MIEVIRGDCPNNNIELRIKYPVGGAVPTANWYFTWFEESIGTVSQYTSNKCTFPSGYWKKVRWDFPVIPLFYAFELPIFGYLDNQGIIGDSLANYLNRCVTGLAGYGRIINVGSNYLEVFLSPSDPINASLTCVTAFVVANTYLLPYPSVATTYNGQAGCCGTTLQNQTITDWKPIASGIGLDNVTVASPRKKRYMVEATDNSGTTDYQILNLDESFPTCGLVVTQPTCFGGRGCIEVTIPEWLNEPLSFEWNVNKVLYSTSKDICDLLPETYCLTIIDDKGCTTNCCATIINPLPIVATTTITQPSCVACGTTEQFGKLYVRVSGGNEDCKVCDNSVINNKTKGAYEYKLLPLVNTWTPTDIDNSIYINNLKPGDYKLKIRDCNCCYYDLDITITKPTIIAKI